MKRIALGIIGVALCLCCAAGAQEPPTTVSEVRVEGNKRLSTNAVLSYVKTRPGTTYEAGIVKADRDRLMASGRFSSVVATRKYTRKGVVVTFKVAERPTVAVLTLRGSKHFKEAELRKELPIGEGDPLNAATIEAGKQALINKYRSEGFHFVSVTVDDEAMKKDNELIYRIVEGPRTIISKVRIEGNHYFSTLNLKIRIDTKAKFWPFITGALNNEKLQRDVTMIRNMYTADGFLDAEVGRRLDFSDDKRKVEVTFIVKEGQRYRINDIRFKGNTVFSGDELRKHMLFRQGAFYSAETMRFDQKRLENAYGALGYIEADIRVEKQFVSPEAPPPAWVTEQDVDGGNPALLNLLATVRENDQFRIGTITIKGNSVTQERVIRRELNFRPEQLYNTVAVERSKRSLMEMRLFDGVNINPTDTTQKDVKDVVVEVAEGRTRELLIGVGVSSNSGLLGTVSYTERNFDILRWPNSLKNLIKPTTFRGAGQRLTISAEPGNEVMRFNVGWFSPYLFDLPYSLGWKGYYFMRDYDDYDEGRIGTQVSLGHRFKNRWYGELSTRLESIDMNVPDDAAVEIIEDEGSHTLLGFRGSLVRDRTDSRWMPSTGDRFNFAYEQVVGTDTFGKFTAGYRIYRTVYTDSLDRKHILAGRLNYGHIVGDAPVFEKFYGGGIGSVRGFKYRGISPRGTWPGGAPHEDPIGGDVMFFAGTEYSFPLVTDMIRGVVFLDSGTVEEKFEITTYRVSAGVGFRWQIPFMGPVPMAFDFGFPLVKDDRDDTQVFSFSLGWTF